MDVFSLLWDSRLIFSTCLINILLNILSNLKHSWKSSKSWITIYILISTFTWFWKLVTKSKVYMLFRTTLKYWELMIFILVTFTKSKAVYLNENRRICILFKGNEFPFICYRICLKINRIILSGKCLRHLLTLYMKNY